MDSIFNINTFDAVVIGLILLLSLKGLVSGFTKELFSALGIIGGLFTATFFNKDVAKYISDNFISGVNIKILELISLIVIFIAVFLLMKLIYKIIESISRDDYISTASRLAGMLLKIVTLFFIFSLIVYSFSSKPQITEKFKDTLSSSSLYPLLKKSGATILNAPALINGDSNTVVSSTTEDNNTQESKKNEANSTNENNKTDIINKNDEKNSDTQASEQKNTNLENENNNTVTLDKKDENSSINTAKSEDKNTTNSIEGNTTKEQNKTNETNKTQE